MAVSTLAPVTEDPRALRDVLLNRAAADPDRLAYDDGNRSIAYGELAANAAGKAVALRRLGVEQGDRVVLTMSAGVEFTEAFWAVQMLGAASCALNPAHPAETLRRRTQQLRPRLVVSDETLAGVGPGAPAEIHADIDPEDIAVLQVTSGTSGEPRAAMLRQRNVLHYRSDDQQALRIGPEDVLVAWVPPWHDLGLVHFVVGCVFHGARCHIVQPAVRTIPDWLATISRTRGTLTGAPDFAFRLASRMVDPATVDITSLRSAVNGGEPVLWSTIERFEERFGVPGRIMPGYGLAEATLGVTTHSPGDYRPVDDHGNVSCGVPFPGSEVRVDGDSSNPGEILVRNRYVFAGYFDAPEDTRAALDPEGWLHTGDVGYKDAKGNLYVLGRQRAMLKRAGAAIAPRELEEAAQRADGVQLAAVVSLPAPTALTDTITVVVEARESAARTADAVAADVSRAIVATSGFAPGRVAVVPPRTIPRTANGKIRHDHLRTLLLEGAIGGNAGE